MEQQVSLIERDRELLAHENSESRFTKDRGEEEGQKSRKKPEKRGSGAGTCCRLRRRNLHSNNLPSQPRTGLL
jgi:hypothetical protein